MLYGSELIDVERVFLDQENPRHEPFSSQNEAIEYLCANEKIYPLAKDIVENGLNPLELFAVIKERGNSYFSAEGNRRLCAIKLLNDPDLAPSRLRKDFEKLARKYAPSKQISVVIFKNRDEVRLWLNRIHAGLDDGRGRKQWNAVQKSRNSKYSKNDFALTLLDVAKVLNFINAEEQKGRLSTVQRYISNPVMRNALGLVAVDNNYNVSFSESDFKIVLSKFIKDVKLKKLSTRENADEISSYANRLSSSEGFDGSRVTPWSLDFFLIKSNPSLKPLFVKEFDSEGEKISEISADQVPQAALSSSHSSDFIQSEKPIEPEVPSPSTKYDELEDFSPESPRFPSKPNKLVFKKEIENGLKEISNFKLQSMYYSLCAIGLNNHTPMLYVGA